MKFCRIMPLLICCTLLTGCWDKVEIDRNIFISVIGIDVGKDIKNEKDIKKIKADEPFGERSFERLNVTYAFPDISQYTAQKGELPGDKFINVKAYSMEDSVSEATRKSSRSINLGDTNLIVFSSDLLKYPDVFKEVIDYISRQPRFNRLMHIVMVDGKTEEFMKNKLNEEKNVESYLSGLMESSERSSAILPVSLNELLIYLSHNGNAILPNMKMDAVNSEVSITGVGMIKNYSLVGSLNSQETSTLEMLRGKMKGGKKVIYSQGHPIDMQIVGVNRKIKLASYNDDKLNLNIDIEVEGKFRGYFLDKSVYSVDSINNIQNNFNKALSEEGERVVKLIQEQYGVDPVGINEYLQKYHPFVWDKVKDKWEDVYKDAVVKVNVDTRIRRIGIKK